jgi:hypothetical protein
MWHFITRRRRQTSIKRCSTQSSQFFNEAIHDIEIGMGVGSCGTAAFMNERVIVDDIQTHPY